VIRWFRRRRRPEAELTEWQREMLTTGLAGFCEHGIGMLDNCEQCCPPAAKRDEVGPPGSTS
jgi:hypothetical protein